jgi:hypothetical protein
VLWPQDESVAASCQSADAHHGCVAPCQDRGACLEKAGLYLDAIGGVAGAVAGYHIPLVSQAAGTVEEVRRRRPALRLAVRRWLHARRPPCG